MSCQKKATGKFMKVVWNHTATNWKLTKIAELVGYTDPKYMSRVFKEETGMLPLEYRKKNG